MMSALSPCGESITVTPPADTGRDIAPREIIATKIAVVTSRLIFASSVSNPGTPSRRGCDLFEPAERKRRLRRTCYPCQATSLFGPLALVPHSRECRHPSSRLAEQCSYPHSWQATRLQVSRLRCLKF